MKTSYADTVDWDEIGLRRFLFQFVCWSLLSRMLPYKLVFMTNFDQDWFFSWYLNSKHHKRYMEKGGSLCLRDLNWKMLTRRGEEKYFIGLHLVSHSFGIMFKFKVPHNVLIGKLDLNSATWPLRFCGSFCSRLR